VGERTLSEQMKLALLENHQIQSPAQRLSWNNSVGSALVVCDYPWINPNGAERS
jgi:hypothetical protein